VYNNHDVVILISFCFDPAQHEIIGIVLRNGHV